MNKFFLSFFCFICASTSIEAQRATPPNVVLIITDDQGYGDLGIHGNHHIKTPHLDALAAESIRLNNFYVSPVCAPTRASLMTGRYSLRTGVRDTYNGGAIMHSSEVTIAEMLKTANYRTGIFGKWHLGDSYPSRPIDNGFDESVIHLSGGMGQVGDFTTWFQGDSSYFDPVLWHNGEKQQYQGYCSDIFTSEAIRFIAGEGDQPFFCYLSFNAPHTPLQVPQKYLDMYNGIHPEEGFDDGRPWVEMSDRNKEDAKKVYAMVSNIDDNVGRLLNTLKTENIDRETIVIFLTDNGPQQVRYVAGMRGRKGSPYRGGTRVPFFFRYPSFSEGNLEIDQTIAHIDILPTLAELCYAEMPTDRVIDGRSFVHLLSQRSDEWPERTLFHYWSRKYPQRYHNMAVQKGPYKLVAHTDYDAPIDKFRLYNLDSDPYEQDNIVEEEKNIAATLKFKLDSIWSVLITEDHLVNPPKIHIGSPHENPVFLNRNDASGDRGIWAQEEVFGKWWTKIEEGQYDLRFKFIKEVPARGKLVLEINTIVHCKENTSETDMIEMSDVYLPAMLSADVIPFYEHEGRRIFPFWVEVERRP